MDIRWWYRFLEWLGYFLGSLSFCGLFLTGATYHGSFKGQIIFSVVCLLVAATGLIFSLRLVHFARRRGKRFWVNPWWDRVYWG